MPFQRQQKWHIPMAINRKKSRRWARLIIWDMVKVPLCRYRVMHRKRVTCELHDSYFRLMTIKYAIPRIEWTLNYYITLSRQDVRELELETRCGREGHARPKGPSRPPVVLETRWWQDVVEKASTQQKAEPPGLRLSSPGERERHNADGHKSRGQYIAVLFGLQLPLTRKRYK